VGEAEGNEKAIAGLLLMNELGDNCYYNASLGELYLKSGKKAEAKKYFEKALLLTVSNAEMELLKRKINSCGN
jgi:predicted negative regulator of RcsB-dependent stress response